MKIVGESEIKIRQEKGRDDAKIRAEWEAYHGPCGDDGYIPKAPPAYSRGYRDGYAEAIAVLDAIKNADIAHYIEHGRFALSESARAAIDAALQRGDE